MSSKQPQESPVAVRLQPSSRERIKEEAKKNFRSMSSEIAARVERTLKEDDSNQKGAPT